MGSYTPNYFRKGLLPLIILSLLKDKDMYGYQLVKEISERSGGVITTQEGALYPILYTLSGAGYISENNVKVHTRQIRVYYHLEPAGEEHLDQLLHEYYQVEDAMKSILPGEEKQK